MPQLAFGVPNAVRRERTLMGFLRGFGAHKDRRDVPTCRLHDTVHDIEGAVRPSSRASRPPHIYGCFARSEHIIMVEAGHPDVLAHELRHANGWEHRGPCHSSEAHPDGLKPNGSPCEWYR